MKRGFITSTALDVLNATRNRLLPPHLYLRKKYIAIRALRKMDLHRNKGKLSGPLKREDRPQHQASSVAEAQNALSAKKQCIKQRPQYSRKKLTTMGA
jgi:hypothetical protein